MAKKLAAQKKSPRSGAETTVDKPKAGSRKNGKKSPFPIVGLGASAGGLEALKTFFAAAPETGGMARSDMNTGMVDMVLSPEAMPQKLSHYFPIRPPARISNPVRPMITRNVSKRTGPLNGGVEA